MILKESPTAWDPAAQAVASDMLGPLAPKRIEIMPGAMLPINKGMKKGLTRLGPFRWMLRIVSSMKRRPPRPHPVITPMRSPLSSVMASRASSTAMRVAAMANEMNSSNRLASFLLTQSSALNPLTSPAIWVS